MALVGRLKKLCTRVAGNGVLASRRAEVHRGGHDGGALARSGSRWAPTASPPTCHAWPAASHGLSGVVYGLLGYLLLIGWLERQLLSILLGIVAFWLYGSALFALIPGVSPAGVSWIGHASGFVAGMAAALAVYREHSPGVMQTPDQR